MRQLLENWRRLINEKAFGTLSMPSGKLPNPCSQGEEQNGFHPDGTPFCRPKPELRGKNKITINTRQEIIYFIKNNPDQEIYLDNPKGTVKKFGGQIPIKLPFDYGEWINLINPEDGKGWDLIIVPSATKEHGNLIPCGYVAYNEKKPSAMGNDKIIIAPDGLARPMDRKTIKDVFSQMDFFDPVVWY